MTPMRRFLLFTITAVLLLQSCKKEKDEQPQQEEDFSRAIQNIVPDSVIARLKAAGLEINAGLKPPTINGIYWARPMTTLYDNSGTAGQSVSDYRYRFYEQNNTDLTIKLDYRGLTTNDAATGAGAYLSGTDNKFTAFLELSGTASGISYKVLSVFSGEATTGGLRNFKHAVYLKEKASDPANRLAPVGTLRIFKDGNDLAETTAVF